MINLDQCAMLHMTMTSAHNTKENSDMEGRIQPGEKAGDIVVWDSRFTTGNQAQPNPWMSYTILMK